MKSKKKIYSKGSFIKNKRRRRLKRKNKNIQKSIKRITKRSSRSNKYKSLLGGGNMTKDEELEDLRRNLAERDTALREADARLVAKDEELRAAIEFASAC